MNTHSSENPVINTSTTPLHDNRIRSLDGLRAISISMVIFGHIGRYLPKSITSSLWYQLTANSTLGVSIFFVISGYLITKLLLIERAKTGTVSLRNFYIRRALRIFPIFYLYIILLLIIKSFIYPNIINNYTEIIFAALYLWNYKHLFGVGGNASLYLAHYWSLSMEEQFYLLWPALFLKTKKEYLIKTVVIILIAMPFIRIATYYLMPGSRGQLHIMIQTGGDTILIGCLGALLEDDNRFKERFHKLVSNNYMGLSSAFFIFVISRLLNIYIGGAYTMSIGQSIENIFVLFFVLWSVYKTTGFSKLLNSLILIRIGVISYSLYVWHVIVLRNPDGWLPQNLILKVVIIFAVALISYYFIETPILKLKDKFKR